MEPQSTPSKLQSAAAALADGRPQEAAARLRELLRCDPTNAAALCLLGVALTELGDPGGSLAAMQRALHLSPGDAAVQYNCGVALEMMGRREEAIGQFNQALQLNPHHEPSYVALARLTGGDSLPSGRALPDPSSSAASPGFASLPPAPFQSDASVSQRDPGDGAKLEAAAKRTGPQPSVGAQPVVPPDLSRILLEALARAARGTSLRFRLALVVSAGVLCAGALLWPLGRAAWTLRRGTLVGARLERAPLAGADLSGADLRGAHLTDATLTDADLTGADLRSARLEGASLSGARIQKANLVGSQLGRARLRGTNLELSLLNSCSLVGADLSGARLRGSFLAHADLGSAILRDADLSNAFLQSANLRGADLRGADLRGADLRFAELEDATLDDLVEDSATLWPAGFSGRKAHSLPVRALPGTGAGD